jgi:hypothetical protein
MSINIINLKSTIKIEILLHECKFLRTKIMGEGAINGELQSSYFAMLHGWKDQP